MFFGSIHSVPSGRLVCADKNKQQAYQAILLKYLPKAHCISRSFDLLSGYVDFKADSIMQGCDHTPIEKEVGNGAHAVCMLAIADKATL